jgi:hypothetical protein
MNSIFKTEESISRENLKNGDLKPESIKVLDKRDFASISEEDEFYEPAVELLDLIFTSIITE